MMRLHCICIYYGCWGQKEQPWSRSACGVRAGKPVLLFDPNAWQTHLQTPLSCSLIFGCKKQQSQFNPELDWWNSCENEVKQNDREILWREKAAENCNEGGKMAAAAERERPGGKNSLSQPWQPEQPDVESKWRLNTDKYEKYTTQNPSQQQQFNTHAS